ncbi:hypothetical protein HYU09_03180 [Candidatus Woesearchaeota archaeon]|nr:hypothetical protein [Candidatus Woesearchaeota archaeon]
MKDEEGVEAVFKKLGPVKAIKFFQRMGVGGGDSVKEIERITEKMSREELIELMKKANPC